MELLLNQDVVGDLLGVDPSAIADKPLAAMPYIGEVLVADGLVTKALLDEALALQKTEGQPLGSIIARLSGLKQISIVGCLLRSAVAPAVHALIDLLTDGLWKTRNGRIEMEQLYREWTVHEDMLKAGKRVESEPSLRGFAVAVIGKQRSLPFEFRLGSNGGDVDRLSARGLMRWVEKQAGAATENPQ